MSGTSSLDDGDKWLIDWCGDVAFFLIATDRLTGFEIYGKQKPILFKIKWYKVM